MLQLQRQEVLDECVWKPGKGKLRYIEARTLTGTTDAATPHTYQEGELDDEDIDDWLHQRGCFVPPCDTPQVRQEGTIRLLLCERLGFHPLGFGMSKASFLAIEDKFELPLDMLSLFKFNGGGHSYHIRPFDSCNSKPEQLTITVKVPQMYQVANYGLCLTYSFKTHTTLGFMFGWNMNSDENWRASVGIERPWYLKPHGPRISKLIKSEVSNWTHALLLPVVLFEDHIYNANRYKGFDLSPKTNKVENRLKVTKAGRIANDTEIVDFEKLSKDMISERFKITTDINTAITDVLTFATNMKWDVRYCQFLRNLFERLENLPGAKQDGEIRLNNTFETLATLLDSILEHTDALKARLNVQLDVLYNLVAQVDSNVNSTIAATAGLDSVAMKALAFVTTLFLPPTFVATLFSMTMFDWQANGKTQSTEPAEESEVVSRNFWIYWLISLPLTAVVLLTWRAWWHREKARYRQKYPHVKLDPDVSSDISDKLKEWFRKRKNMTDIELPQLSSGHSVFRR